LHERCYELGCSKRARRYSRILEKYYYIKNAKIHKNTTT